MIILIKTLSECFVWNYSRLLIISLTVQVLDKYEVQLQDEW